MSEFCDLDDQKEQSLAAEEDVLLELDTPGAAADRTVEASTQNQTQDQTDQMNNTIDISTKGRSPRTSKCNPSWLQRPKSWIKKEPGAQVAFSSYRC